MKRRLLVFSLFFMSYASAMACGYAFVGGCSTDLSLRVNGSDGLFAIAPCNGEVNFDGLQLGEIRSLHLVQARAITWESCQNNVSSVQLRYRVWPAGQPGGVWQEVDLAQVFDTLGGPYTTRYRETTTDINLGAGLNIGQDYILEVYFYAQVDTLGDDFIPETFMLQDNNGLNYQARFRYGGPVAPPLAAITTVKQDVFCHGDSNGIAGVRVFGAHHNLFYQWSYQTQNFFTHFDLPAGQYSVTVTEDSTNFTVVHDYTITEPEALVVLTDNITQLGCDGTPGGATLTVTGGTPPYQYHWSHGETTEFLLTAEAGVYTVSVIDASQCAAESTITIESYGQVSLQVDTVFCAGDSLVFQGQAIYTPGEYAFLLAGAGGCDTLINLNAQVVDLSGVAAALPDSATITCDEPLMSFCAGESPGAQYSWQFDGVEFSTFPCVATVESGTYLLTVSQLENGRLCNISHQITVVKDMAPPVLTGITQATLCNGRVSVHCIVEGGMPPYAAQWSDPDLGGLQVEATPGYYVVSIMGANGCQDQAGILVEDFFLETQSLPASGPNIADGMAKIMVLGSVNPPYQINWDNGEQGNMISNILPGWYCATVIDQTGCTRDTCIFVDFVSESTQPISQTNRLSLSPNPAVPGAAIHIDHVLFPAEIEVYDAQNKRVFQATLTDDEPTIQLPSDLRQGMYFFCAHNQHFWAVEKIFLLFIR